MRRISKPPKVTVYKEVQPKKAFSAARGLVGMRYAAEIDGRDGAPKKILGATMERLANLVGTNLRSMSIQSFELNTDPEKRHAKMKLHGSVAPGAEIKPLTEKEAGRIRKLLQPIGEKRQQ